MLNIEIQTDETPAVYLYNLLKTIIRLASEAEGESEEIIYLSEIGCAIALAVFKQESETQSGNEKREETINEKLEISHREESNNETESISNAEIDSIARQISTFLHTENIPVEIMEGLKDGISNCLNDTNRRELREYEQSPAHIAMLIRDYYREEDDKNA